MKTISEIQIEIGEIIKLNKTWDERLPELMKAGYTGVTYTWTRAGGIGRVFYLKRKHIYRIQVAQTELQAKFPIAWCVEIPAHLVIDDTRLTDGSDVF